MQPVGQQTVEIVERKGIGHPDTICDALAEQLSSALCHFYLERFGFILHHNVDKALLWGGRSRPAFGGGEVLQPMEVFLAGRAIQEYRGVSVPLEDLAVAAGRQWLDEHFHALDPQEHVKFHCLIRPGSAELVEVFERQMKTGIPLANDTSCGVGYAPLDELEKLVYHLEQHLNTPDFKSEYPETGEDIKVMAIRKNGQVRLTVACAFIDRHLKDIDDYAAKKERLQIEIARVAKRWLGHEAEIELNTADEIATGSIYLTVTGTSAEAGDDGEVGRGNRVNGLITPCRPMNMEAVAGKNPVTHVGKLYNLAANQMAASIYEQFNDVVEVYCFLVSQIGHPINDPQVVNVQVRTREASQLESVRPQIEAVTQAHLTTISSLWREWLTGAISTY